jgi:hypothetical protein
MSASAWVIPVKAQVLTPFLLDVRAAPPVATEGRPLGVPEASDDGAAELGTAAALNEGTGDVEGTPHLAAAGTAVEPDWANTAPTAPIANTSAMATRIRSPRRRVSHPERCTTLTVLTSAKTRR